MRRALVAMLVVLHLAIFAAGTVTHRYAPAWAGRFVRRPPPELS